MDGEGISVGDGDGVECAVSVFVFRFDLEVLLLPSVDVRRHAYAAVVSQLRHLVEAQLLLDAI
jgi:hypothetical protein